VESIRPRTPRLGTGSDRTNVGQEPPHWFDRLLTYTRRHNRELRVEINKQGMKGEGGNQNIMEKVYLPGSNGEVRGAY